MGGQGEKKADLQNGGAGSTFTQMVSHALLVALGFTLGFLAVPSLFRMLPWSFFGDYEHVVTAWISKIIGLIMKTSLILVSASSMPDLTPYWSVHMLLSFVAASGGSHLVAVLTGSPMPILTDPDRVAYFLASWYLGAYTPIGKLIRSNVVVNVVFTSMANFVSVRACFIKIDYAAETYPDSWGAALLLGSLSSGAGGTQAAFLKFLFGITAHPGPIWEPHFSMRRSILVSLAYCTLSIWTNTVSRLRMREAVLPFIAAHAALRAVGYNLDFTVPIFHVFYFLTRIPNPSVACEQWPRPQVSVAPLSYPRNGLHFTLLDANDMEVWEQFLQKTKSSKERSQHVEGQSRERTDATAWVAASRENKKTK